MQPNRTRWVTVVASCAYALATAVYGQPDDDALKAGFRNPPNSARPRVWWHWVNGNISKEGIELDLNWMRRVGIGGFQSFDVSQWTPEVVVPHRIVYMSKEWKDAFRYATHLADLLGLEQGIASSPGYSETGGPQVRPAEAMKKYVWSETVVGGGKRFVGVLSRPPSNPGAFQTLGPRDFALDLGVAPRDPDFYADSAVIAYRIPSSDDSVPDSEARVTSSGNSVDAARLTDGDLRATTPLPVAPLGQQSWIQYEFRRPETLRAITLVMGDQDLYDSILGPGGESGRALEASDDGQTFHRVAILPKGAFPHTVSFPPATARFFRVTFETMAPATNPLLPVFDIGWLVPAAAEAAPVTYGIAELLLHRGARVNHFEEKAGFDVALDLYRDATPEVTSSEAIRKADVIDLTAKLRSGGRLSWDAPPGQWMVLRFGYSLLGVHNEPAVPEATGLEVDKLSGSFVTRYMDRYLDTYQDVVGKEWMGKHGIKFVVTDSWESGTQNWTDHMIQEFRKRRGYDMKPWMPVLTGRVVESARASDRFLWDFRKTISDLVAAEHYGAVQSSLKARGMGHYGEAHEVGRALIADGMELKKLDDIPMGAMWTQRPGTNRDQYGFNADDRESASVAHIYGRPVAAAESFTAGAAPFAWSPATLKPTADRELLEGINRFVIHCSVHQPLLDKAPGLTFGPFGQWFTRNETWAEDAGAWIDYLSRSSYLLQQGRFVADVLYFYGEDSNLTAIFGDTGPVIPPGYGYDYVNADAILHELSVKQGQITTNSGMRYRVLALDRYTQHMSLPVLRKIRRLVEQGMVVAGPKPTETPSLADDEREFRKLADSLWGNRPGRHPVGAGMVFSDQTASDALASLSIDPDFDYSQPSPQTKVEFVHRKRPDADIYFIANRSDHATSFDATFRVTRKSAELWYPDSGASEPVSYQNTNGRTSLHLDMGPWGTVFALFRTPTNLSTVTFPKPRETTLATLEGPWDVNFQQNRGAPQSVVFDKLQSWSDNRDEGIKYFSGSATYTKMVTIPQEWLTPGTQLLLDLGRVKELAHVTVNGNDMGVVWHTPFRLDVTRSLSPGPNLLSIKVTNLWVNRLIGDARKGAKTKYSFTFGYPYDADSRLLESGLLGPVLLIRRTSRTGR